MELNGLYEALAILGFVIGTVVLIVFMVRHTRAKETITAPLPPSEVTDTTTTPAPSPPSLSLASRQPLPSWMDRHEQAKAKSRATGKCLYNCPAVASHPEPGYKKAKHWYDGLLRYYGVKQLERYWVWLGGRAWNKDAAVSYLCDAHFDQATALLESHLAQKTAETAATQNGYVKSLYEYEVAGVYKAISEDMDALRATIPAIKPNGNGTTIQTNILQSSNGN